MPPFFTAALGDELHWDAETLGDFHFTISQKKKKKLWNQMQKFLLLEIFGVWFLELTTKHAWWKFGTHPIIARHKIWSNKDMPTNVKWEYSRPHHQVESRMGSFHFCRMIMVYAHGEYSWDQRASERGSPKCHVVALAKEKLHGQTPSSELTWTDSKRQQRPARIWTVQVVTYRPKRPKSPTYQHHLLPQVPDS